MRFYWAILLLVVNLQPAMGQQIHQFHHLTPGKGLTSGKYNNYVHQDNNRYIWISSTAGLNRFDGKRVKTYRRESDNPFSLSTELSAQSRFAEFANGDLIFTTGIGFTRYLRQTDDFRHYNLISAKGDTIRNSYLWAYLSPDERHLFVSGGEKLYWVNPERPVEQHFVDDKFVYLKDRMTALGNGNFLLAHFPPEGPTVSLYWYNVLKGKTKELTLRVKDRRKISDLRFVSQDSLLIATDRGLVGYGIGQEAWYTYPGTEELDIVELELFGKDQLYFATRKGHLILYTPERGTAHTLLQNTGSGIDTFVTDIERLYVAPDSILWVSTVSSGVFHTNLRKPALKMLALHRPGSSSDVVGLALGQEGTIYALFTGYVAISKEDGVSYVELPVDGTGFNLGAGIFIDDSETLWVGTYADLYYLEKGQKAFAKYQPLPGLSSDYPPGFFAPSYLPNGDLFLPTNTSYPYFADRSTGTIAPWLTSVSRVREAVFDPKGRGILSTFQDSLHLVSSLVGVEPVRDTSIFGLGLVNGIVYDERREYFWVGSYAGLLRVGYDERSGWWVRETASELVNEAIISSLLQDKQGQVWFTTDEGVHRYAPDTDELRTYRISDGAQASDFNLGVAANMPNGDLLFGGPQGINRIRPEELSGEEESGRLAITSVVINGETNTYRKYQTGGNFTDGDLALHSPYTSRDIEIGLSAFDYKDPDNVSLLYSFNSRNEAHKFRPVPTTSIVDLFNLAPGDYELWLKGEDSFGRIILPRRAASISILPPLYLTWWAYTLYVLAILGIISAFFWQILIKEREKAARARAEVEAAETTTSILRLQMNPHFIFNSLNSIDDYILDEAPMKAHDYLVMFAELMRDILNRSTQPLTRLDQEIEMLEKYIEAERMRLGDGLRYVVELIGDIDTVSTYIPTMILQPFVENAIWHGIGNRESGGLITLRFELDEANSSLVATVEDDGRGRRTTEGSSAANAKKGTKKHASKALNITRQRLDLLNRKLTTALPTSLAPASAPSKAAYKILDLTRDDGSSRGTKVVLYLPLIYPE